MSLRDAPHEDPLYIYNDEVIFDFSMGEAREGASEGCLLLEGLVQQITSFHCEDNVLLACVKETESYIDFQLVAGTELSKIRSRPRHPPKDNTFVAKLRPNLSGFTMFDIVARAGELKLFLHSFDTANWVRRYREFQGASNTSVQHQPIIRE